MKDYQSNKKYFTQRSPIPFHVTFVFLVTISIALICLGPRMYPIGFTILAVGAVMEVTVIQRNVSDKYFETFLPEEKEHFISDFEKAYRPVDPRTLHPNAKISASLTERHGAAIYCGEYRFLPKDFELLGLDTNIRRGLDGVARSSVYSFSGLQIDPCRVCLMTRRIGMTEPVEKTESAAYPYTVLSSVSLISTPLSCGIASAHCIEMVFFDREEKELFRLPVHGGCDNEEQVETLNELIRKSTIANDTPKA